jgi:hypothetical protein
MAPPPRRPFGVTLLTALQILLGILVLLGGVAQLFVGFVLPEMFPHVRFFAPRSILSGLGLIALALIDFILAFGLWHGKKWAWVASLIFAVIGIGFSVFSLFIRPRVGEFVSLILDLVILYYLMQPRVQSFFGRGGALTVRRARATPR